MKLYDSATAPNPRRVRIFLAEKGIVVPTEQVDIGKGANRSPEYLAKNSLGGVPILALDDGSILAESVAICAYFEGLHPQPPLLGVDPRGKAFVEMWQRRMELGLFLNTTGCFRHTHAFFRGKVTQVPEYGAACKEAALRQFAWLDTELAKSRFIAGDQYTIADITALVGVDFGKVSDIRISAEQKNLSRWYEEVSTRPSAKA